MTALVQERGSDAALLHHCTSLGLLVWQRIGVNHMLTLLGIPNHLAPPSSALAGAVREAGDSTMDRGQALVAG